MRLISFFLLSLFVLSCSSGTVEEEMQEYCSCLRENLHNPEGRDQCLELMEAILDKYSYDPDALKEIMEVAENC